MIPPALQAYTHILDAVKGYFDDAALDFGAMLSANVTFIPQAGTVVHLNADGEFEMGCTGGQMPIFLKSNPNHPSAVTPANLDTFRRAFGLVAEGAYELESTEYDHDQTYLPNQPLRAIASNSDSTTGGRLTNQGVITTTATADPSAATATVGIVSRPPRKRIRDGATVLAFWPKFERGGTGL